MAAPTPQHGQAPVTADLRLQAEAVRQLYAGIRRVVPLMPVVPLALVVGLWTYVDHAALLLWFAAAVVTPAWQIVAERRYRVSDVQADDAPRWARYITLSSLVEGITWGAAGILFYVPDALPAQLVLIGLIVAMPAGSVFATSWWPATFYAVAYSEVGLTALGLAYRGNTGETGMAIALGIYMLMLHQMIRQAHNTVMETIAVRFENTDLVEQLREEKQVAEQANVAKSKFLAAASHDLRQPLHALTLFVRVLEERTSDVDTLKVVGDVQRSATALESLFQSLLDISHMDAGTLEVRRIHFPLTPMVDALRAEYAPQAEARDLHLDVHSADLIAYSDPALVERILRNLLANAVRYTRKGEIRLVCTHSGDAIAIEIQDTGVGIPADRLEDVFQEFVQLDNSERDRSKGLGLGLSIVRRLAALLGTRVTVQSTLGAGSSFRFTLPVGDAAACAAASADPATPDSALSGVVVGVIDDEADVRQGMCMLLENWGCRVVTAEDAAGLIASLEAAALRPDLLIADYRLRANATGPQAIRQAREHFGDAIPGFIISGDTGPGALADTRAHGHALLHKPVKPAQLRALMHYQVGATREIDGPTSLAQSSCPPF